MSLVLASGSPRRRELLAALALPYLVDPADIDESSAELDPVVLAEILALSKAREVARRRPDDIVIGSDTVVALDGRLLGKPSDAAEARAMLNDLRGRAHDVVTGVAVVGPGGIEAVAHSRTVVVMRAYADDERDEFIARGEPFDKAGGYAIQDVAFHPVARIEGCECGVMGLPLWTLRRLLIDAGVQAGVPALDRCAGCPARSEVP
ncbi:MAG: septum formation protein Maf [Dehalococcoidia bacterium]|nr:MAG: septum formation protein Maf [Dehalococcoidia bacterium]